MSVEKVKVFIVDSRPVIVAGLQAILSGHTGVNLIGHCTSGQDCLQFVKKHTIDVILLNVMLPDKAGLEVCVELLQLKPSIKVVALHIGSDGPMIAKMLEKGARAYITANASPDEICTAVLEAAKGHVFLSKDAADNFHLGKAPTKNIISTVTKREKEILKLIADGMTATEIAAKLFLSRLTVESHKRNVMSKLKARNTAVLIKIAIQNELI